MACENCGTDGVDSQSIHVQSVELCEACRRHFILVEQYEQRLTQLAQALENKDYRNALETLRLAEVELGHLDTSGWLLRTILSDRGMVLQEQGNWQAAFVSYEARLQLSFSDPADEALTLLAGARMLLRLQRPTDASAFMRTALDCLEKAHPKSALPMILTWLEEGESGVLAGRGTLIESALRAYNLTPPAEVSKDPMAALFWAKEWGRK